MIGGMRIFKLWNQRNTMSSIIKNINSEERTIGVPMEQYIKNTL